MQRTALRAATDADCSSAFRTPLDSWEKERVAMFEKERFIEECRIALKESDPRAAIRELVARAVSEPAHIVQALGEPKRAGIETIYQANDLTILNLCWGPRMVFKPHDHRMWAVIGIYGGLEQNIFYHRSEYGLKQHGTKGLQTKDTIPLGATIIHAVINPLGRITGAIHVYGGDFFATPRSEWNPQTFEEQPFDVADAIRAFEDANKLLHVREKGTDLFSDRAY
jgi:predicted metal-dependent enzyme (double-stranded beta helix superfamily)